MDIASHSLVLLQQLNIQREFGFLCDCTVAIGDVYFKAHRAVLAAFSNYFKMIFIHQSSECIKIQPADIQPDIFSYLLHIMYTGKCPKQTVDHSRLEEGIRFLHANHLSRNPNEVSQGFIYDIMPSSNLYGIQISSAQKTKETVTKEKVSGNLGDKPDMQSDHRQFQLSLAIGLEGTSSEHQFSHLPSSASDLIQTAGEVSKSSNTIKQEKCDPELPVVPQVSFPPSVEGSAPNSSKVNIKVHTCHYCGEQFNSRGSLVEHVYTHASGSLPFGVPSSILESNDLGEVQPLSEDISPQEGHPVLGFRVNETSQPLEKSNSNNMENLVQVNQQVDPMSLMQTEADPLELNCNYSFSRKRKFACAVCGQKFLQKHQLLEHMYSHTDLSEPESSSSMSSSLQPTETEEEPPCKRKEVSVFRQEIQQVLHSFPALEMESSFRDHFPQYDSPAIHCHYKCNQRNCEAVTLDSKKGDQFAHKWLSDRSVACCKRTGVYWLVFEEGQGMYCFLCRKHNTYNKQNKVKVFNTTPAVRFKKSAIQDHAQSQQHMLSILAELASRESNTVMMAKEKEEISLLSSAFRTAYWLAKEEIPCAKLVSLLNFLKDPCLQERKYFETVDSVQNIYSCLGIAIQNQLMQTIQQAGCYGLLFGKLINTELEDLLLAFIQYVEPITAEVKTKFLFAKYVGRNADQSEADVIVELIKSSIKDLGLSSHKMTSAVTDGADVMTHKALGVTAQFKEIVPTLIAFHSLFPKLSFIAGADKSSQDRYMEDIEECMAEIWKLFSTSSRLVTLYLEELLEMKGLGFTSKKVKEFVHRKLLQTCRARQCLLVASAEGICNDYSILLKILSDFQNSSRNASNLLRKLQSVMFIGSVYILREVYPILLTLTNIFQKGKVNFTTMESSVNYSVHQLNEVVNSKRPLVKLKNDLMPNGCLSYTKMTLDTQQEGELNRLLEAHVSAIKRNISSRLDSCLPLLSAFSIFNPLLVPSIDSPNFFEYGHQEIMVLSNHFYRRDEKKDAKIKELKDEWEHFKLDLCNWKNIVPADVLTGCAMTVTEWSLKCLFTMKRESGHPYPNLLPFAEICLSIPFTSMWPKEGLTALRRLEKDCEGHINSGLLNSWLHIVINGPEFGVPDCSSIVYGGIKTFMNQRQPQLSSPFKMKSLGRAVDSQASDDDTVERCQEFKDIQSEVCEVINALGISAGLEDLSNVPA